MAADGRLDFRRHRGPAFGSTDQTRFDVILSQARAGGAIDPR